MAQRAKAEGWKIGIKTVRGAYIVIERQRAASLGYEDPIQPSLEDTHNNYNRYASSCICNMYLFEDDCANLAFCKFV